ncbi:MAG: hypothetical protein MUO70_01140 [Euryarchaeota archaeon]|nr:hypothetical protein [Euryarchaeota archaeon]
MQSVYLNRKGLQSIEIEEPLIRLPLKPGGKATLDIDVINFETPTHIYLSSRGAVKDKVTFNRNNPYVDGEELLTATISNPLGQQELYEGEISISTGYGSREESFILQIGHLEDEQSLDAIEIDDDLSRLDYRNKARSPQVRRPEMHLQWPDLDLDVKRIRRMRNLPYILLGIGVIFALLLLLSGSISYGVAILGFIVIVVLAYYTWRLLD